MDPRDSYLTHRCGLALRLSPFDSIAEAWLKTEGNTNAMRWRVA